MSIDYYGLPAKEFYCPSFYNFCIKNFEEARHYLKTCGKPKDDVEIWFIQEAKWTAAFYSKLLNIGN